jgi:hypothetical protein
MASCLDETLAGSLQSHIVGIATPLTVWREDTRAPGAIRGVIGRVEDDG